MKKKKNKKKSKRKFKKIFPLNTKTLGNDITKYPFVEIEWLDSCRVIQPWSSSDDEQYIESEEIIKVVGYVKQATDIYVIITMGYHPSNEGLCTDMLSVFRIPNITITSIHKLEVIK